MIIVYLIIGAFIGYVAQTCVMRIMLGYMPAKYSFKNINGEIRIYHNGLSESQCVDEHEWCMNYYYVVPEWINWLFFNFDVCFDDRFQKNAIECRNLKDLR